MNTSDACHFWGCMIYYSATTFGGNANGMHFESFSNLMVHLLRAAGEKIVWRCYWRLTLRARVGSETPPEEGGLAYGNGAGPSWRMAFMQSMTAVSFAARMPYCMV